MSDQVQRTRARLAELDRQQQYYFYERLTNPKAYEVLRSAGAFERVTPPEVVEGKVLHYAWPPTLYLKNVVKVVPEKVAALITKIDTQNQRVTYDLVDLVRELPAPLQEGLVGKVLGWLDRPHLDYSWSNYIAIMASLAADSRFGAAMSVARRLLKLLPKDDFEIPALGYRSRSAIADLGDMAFEQIVEGIIDAFVARDPIALVNLLASKLKESLDIETRAGSDSDYSSIWAKSLKERPLGGGVKETLTRSLISTSRRVLQDKGGDLESVLTAIANKRWPIFKRMRVRLIIEFGKDAQAQSELLSRGFFRLIELDAERDELLAAVYPKLTANDKKKVIDRIVRALPSEERVRDFLKERTSEQELDEGVRRFRSRELFDRLKPIGGSLHGADAALYERLEEEFKEESSERFTGLFVGPQSPREPKELRAMSTPELMEFVETWRAQKKHFAPSYAGLGLAVASVVEERSAEFLAQVSRLLGWQQVYVWHVINALRKHVAESGFDVAAFVRLLTYVQSEAYRSINAVELSGDVEDEDEEDALETGSSLGIVTAFAISDVLRSPAMAMELRNRLWSILKTLLNDPDPTVEDDLRRKSDRAPWNAGLNSVRGAAMLAVFDFARWLYRSNGGDTEKPDLSAIAPELFSALKAHLGAYDPSPAVRAVYGQNFVSIYVMARSWTIETIPLIFDGTDAGRAAWRSYLALNDVYDETYNVLAEQYSVAVDSLPEEEAGASKDDPSIRGLANHVIRIYARGHSDLSAELSLIRRFLRNANPEVMGIALSSAGAGLSGPTMPTEVWDRMRSFYETVLDDFASRSLEDRQAALPAFGSWIGSPTIERGWALRSLARTAVLTEGQFWGKAGVLEWLAATSDIEPLGAVEALREIVTEGNAFGFIANDAVRVILANGVEAGGEALRIAQQVDEKLTRFGIHEFHELFRIDRVKG